MSDPLDIQDYLDATSDAAKRTRSASIAVVIASIIVFAGLLNSLQNSWLRERLRTSNDIYSKYVVSKIGDPPRNRSPNSIDEQRYEIRYKEFYSALVRTYVETSYVIRVPFFGFRVDVNDLGVLGGISFVVILVMLRFCISREFDNLTISFTEAERLGQVGEFYTLLAMRQVFTIPASRSIRRGPFLVWVPKLFCFAPLIVHMSVMVHDWVTAGIGAFLSSAHTQILFVCEALIAVAIFTLTIMVVTRLRRVDKLWDEKWLRILGEVKKAAT
jgi:hypothetical protein